MKQNIAPPAAPAPKAKPERSPQVDPFSDLMALPMKGARAEFERRYVRRIIEAC